MSLKFEIPHVKTIVHLNNSAKPVGGRMKRTHVIAIFNCGAKWFLYKNGYHYYVTHSTVQKRSMIFKDLQPCDHRTHNSGKLLIQRNWRTGPFGESLLLCTSSVVASRDAIAGVCESSKQKLNALHTGDPKLNIQYYKDDYIQFFLTMFFGPVGDLEEKMVAWYKICDLKGWSRSG
jgi:hypothetical protein